MATVGQRKQAAAIRSVRTLGRIQEEFIAKSPVQDHTLLMRQRDEAYLSAERACTQNALLYGNIAAQRCRIQDQQRVIGALRGRPSWEAVFVYTCVLGVLATAQYFV